MGFFGFGKKEKDKMKTGLEKTGTGFTFAHYNADDLRYTINYAKKIYFDHREDWNDILCRGMEQDFSWGSSALQYQGMYDWILRGMQD